MSDRDSRNPLNTFTDEMHLWSQNGPLPALASREMRYVLTCQAERLKALGLTMEESLEHTEGEITGEKAGKGETIDAATMYREGVRLVTFRQNGKILRRIRKPVTFYATMLNKRGYQDFSCTCPNCGHTDMASRMREKCAYCGTVFEIEDAWPVFSSYYFVPGVVERANLGSNLKRVLLRIFLASAVILAVLCLILNRDQEAAERIFGAVFGGLAAGGAITFFCYMFYSFFLLGKMFREAGRSMPLLKGMRTEKKLEERMRQYEPDFSYPYFEGRLISLLRAVAYSSRRETLSIYEGSQNLSFLDTLVDMQYRGVLQLLNFQVTDGVIRVRLRAFMDDLRYGRRIRRKDENFIVTMERDVEAGDDPGFQLHQVKCRSCAGSFDAYHRKTCPYCGSAYRLSQDDWMITSIERG